MSTVVSNRMRLRDERGQSTLEVVGLAPLLLVVCLLLLQGGLALYGISATETAARNAARAASLGDSANAAAHDALPGWLDPTVNTSGNDETGRRVEVRVNLPDLVPGTDLIVTRDAVMP